MHTYMHMKIHTYEHTRTRKAKYILKDLQQLDIVSIIVFDAIGKPFYYSDYIPTFHCIR